MTSKGKSSMTWMSQMVFGNYNLSVLPRSEVGTCGLGVIHAALTRKAVQNSRRQ